MTRTPPAVTAAPIDSAPAPPASFPYGPPIEADARFCPYCYRSGSAATCDIQAHWPEPRGRHPVYLSGVHCAATEALEAAGADIGLILQPGSNLHRVAPRYRYWAADNGCFARGATFDAYRWFVWLCGLPDVTLRRRCLFATAPDVLCDARATWERSAPWLPLIRAAGVPAAVVGQNGVEDHAPTWDNDDLWDVMFIDGDTAWKCSDDARSVAREAQLRGKWVYMSAGSIPGAGSNWSRRGTSTRWTAPTSSTAPRSTAADWPGGCTASTPTPPCSEPSRWAAAAHGPATNRRPTRQESNHMNGDPSDNCDRCGTPLCGAERMEDLCPGCLAQEPPAGFESARERYLAEAEAFTAALRAEIERRTQARYPSTDSVHVSGIDCGADGLDTLRVSAAGNADDADGLREDFEDGIDELLDWLRHLTGDTWDSHHQLRVAKTGTAPHMTTVGDAKARLAPAARLVCVADTARPELNGTTWTVVEARSRRWRYRLDDGTEAWCAWPSGVTIVDGDTIRIPLGGARHVTLRFAEGAKWYLVRWEIDLEASSARDAARQALVIQRDPTSTATFFAVEPAGESDESEVELDLLDTSGE